MKKLRFDKAASQGEKVANGGYGAEHLLILMIIWHKLLDKVSKPTVRTLSNGGWHGGVCPHLDKLFFM